MKHDVDCGERWRKVLHTPWLRVFWCTYHHELEFTPEWVVGGWRAKIRKTR